MASLLTPWSVLRAGKMSEQSLKLSLKQTAVDEQIQGRTSSSSAVLWRLRIAESAVLRRLRRTFKVESVYASRDAFCGADAEPLSLQWSVRSG